MNRYIALDIETGGLGQDYSILSAYFEILNHKLEPVACLQLFIKPDDGIYKVSAGGLEVNGINLVLHDKQAVTQKAAKTILYDWLKTYSNDGEVKLIPLGYNIWFDVQFLWSTLISRKSWEHYVSYHVVEVGSIAAFLKHLEWNNIEQGSLTTLAASLGIPIKDAHTACGDVTMTVAVYKKLKALVEDVFTR